MLTALVLRSKAYWGYDEAFMARCRDELTLSAEDIRTGTVRVLVADGAPVGVYALEPVGAGRMELTLLFVEPGSIGRGHGRALVEDAKRLARERGAAVLEVQGDPHARRFYEAVGGRLVGTRPSASIPGRELPLFEIALG